MTTIAACVHNGVGAIAADNNLSFSGEPHVTALPKLRQIAPWLVLGWTGDGYGCTFLRKRERIASTPSGADEAAAWLEGVADDLHSAVQGRDVGGVMIALTPWGIGLIHTDGSAHLLGDKILTIGSGGDYATGAMDMLLQFDTHPDLTAAAVARLGVACASRWDAGTGSPSVVVTMPMAIDHEDTPPPAEKMP